MDCRCGCHKGGKPCGMCCAAVIEQVHKPAPNEDKSADILKKAFKKDQ